MILSGFSALIRVLIIFFLMFAGIRRNLSIPLVFLLGGLGLSLIFLMPPEKLLISFFYAIISKKTISLASIVTLITIFGMLLDKTGATGRIAEIFRQSGSGSRIGLAAFPALIGLLPVPGGAVFSAPLVKTLASNHGIGPSRMSLINYWYRHIWEYLWPLYPGILLASSISGLGLGTIAILMIPFTILAIILGLIFIPWRTSQEFPENSDSSGSSGSSVTSLLFDAFHEIVPILMVVLPSIIIAPVFSYFFQVTGIFRELVLMLSLVAGIIYLVTTGGANVSHLKEIVRDKKLMEMFFMVISIMIFKKILEDTGAAKEMGIEISRAGIPLFLAAFILPFITGMVTGISVAFVGISLPVIVSIAQMTGNAALIKPLTALAISSGFMGVMLSPLHLCLILSNAYFGADQLRFYRRLAPQCAIIIIFGLTYYLAIRTI